MAVVEEDFRISDRVAVSLLQSAESLYVLNQQLLGDLRADPRRHIRINSAVGLVHGLERLPEVVAVDELHG